MLWENATLLNATSLDPAVLDEAKLAPYVTDELAEIMLVVEGGGDVVMQVRGTSLLTLIESGLTLPSATPEAEWRSAFLFDGAETRSACAAEARLEPIRTTLAVPASSDLEARLMRDEPDQGEGLAIYRFALWVR